MDKRKLGSLEVSVVGVGCDTFGRDIDEARAAEVCNAALDAGINFFDTADAYGKTKSEEFMGRVLKARRDEAVIATKFGEKVNDGPGGTSAAYARTALEASLRRLDTDHVDLYLIHHPDPTTPIAETLGVMAEFVKQGKVLEIGCSNFSLAQLREAEAAVAPGDPKLACIQNHYNLLQREAELDVLPECEATGLAFVPFYPLYRGLLTGKYRRNEPRPEGARLTNFAPERQATLFTDRNFDIVEQLIAFCESRGHTILELAFARLLAQPAIPSVIAGATSPEQVKANIAATDWVLSADEIAEVDRLAPVE